MTIQQIDTLAPLLPDQVHRLYRRFGYQRLSGNVFTALVRAVLDEANEAEVQRVAQWSDEYARRWPPVVEAPAGYQADEAPDYTMADADEMAAVAHGVSTEPVLTIVVDLAHARARAQGHPCIG